LYGVDKLAVKDVAWVLDKACVVSDLTKRLTRWAANYYIHTSGYGKDLFSQMLITDVANKHLGVWKIRSIGSSCVGIVINACDHLILRLSKALGEATCAGEEVYNTERHGRRPSATCPRRGDRHIILRGS
jgi:hypothetical protein